MKKLNNKQMKQITAGKASGALFGGIAAIVKGVFDGVANITNSICGWVFGFKEASKHHDKMNVKIGNTNVSFDDSASIKSEHDLEVQKIKANKGSMDNHKPEKIVFETLPENKSTTEVHTKYSHHDEDSNYFIDSSLHMSDDFIHF